jgi:hypothetical protein
MAMAGLVAVAGLPERGIQNGFLCHVVPHAVFLGVVAA